MNLPTMVASRQRADRLPLIGLPVSGLLGASATVETKPVRATGMDAVVGLATSNVAGSVVILGAPAVARGRPGTFVRLAGPIATSVDAESGRQVAVVDQPVRADFIKVRYVNGPAAQGAFEMSFSLIPIYAYKSVSLDSGDISIGAVEIKDQDSDLRADVRAVGGENGLVVAGQLIGNQQAQTVEALPLLAGAASFDGAEKDNLGYEAMSASLTVSSTLGTTVTVRFQQRASGADTFRDADVATFAVPAGAAPGPLVNFDRVWSATRRLGRIRIENVGANPLTTAELVVMQKPIS